jgi:hypothetical protein
LIPGAVGRGFERLPHLTVQFSQSWFAVSFQYVCRNFILSKTAYYVFFIHLEICATYSTLSDDRPYHRKWIWFVRTPETEGTRTQTKAAPAVTQELPPNLPVWTIHFSNHE